MGFINRDAKNIFETEASWSFADKNTLCLDTGDWRTERPVVDKEKCNGCGICVMYCPPQCMVDDGEDFYMANLDFCKGCGVCAVECPKKAIKMISEQEYADECTFVE
jgi:pyruvate ferredoxin oxidoreductase delta subunit